MRRFKTLLVNSIVNAVFIAVSLMILSCKSTQDYSFEQNIHNLTVDSMSKLGFDFNSSLNIYEKDLIAEGYLKDRSAQSYKSFIDSLGTYNYFDNHYNFSDSLKDEFVLYANINN